MQISEFGRQNLAVSNDALYGRHVLALNLSLNVLSRHGNVYCIRCD